MSSDATPPFSEAHQIEAVGELEELAQKLRALIVSQPPKELLGYLYSMLALGQWMQRDGAQSDEKETASEINDAALGLDEAQFLLEYVHASFASSPAVEGRRLDESVCARILEVASELRARSMIVAMMVAASSNDSQFGERTRDVMFRALSNWILLRGNRYQVLEEEFLSFALAPHDDALKRVYGVGSLKIAKGIQDLTDAIRLGHARAAEAIHKAMGDAQQFLGERGLSMEEGLGNWQTERPGEAAIAGQAMADLFQGGICNVSRQTQMSESLLDDLSYAEGEEKEFFGSGTYSGTPFRSLPARRKPLLKLGSDAYQVDPSFTRDASYRAILHNLLQREPGYRDDFNKRQKVWSESAFYEIFERQLKGARVFGEVYYRHNGNWFENDTLLLLDDVLILVEAKSGAAATIASPAGTFSRHARDVQDLVIKAYTQSQRFLNYLGSAEEVPLYRLVDGRYEELTRVRLGDYRVVLPIGLTVESYSPFSTGAKELPGIAPILGKHPFVSLSIDEILVLSRFLPTTGQLLHYLTIRQQAAGLEKAFLFDEMDHLGAYIRQNRFADVLREQLSEGPDLLLTDGMSAVVDEYFSEYDWNDRAPPRQPFPEEVENLLGALDATRGLAWLEADNHIRDFGSEGREDLAGQLGALRNTLSKYPRRYFSLAGDVTFLFWLHREDDGADIATITASAQALCISVGVERVLVVKTGVDNSGNYRTVQAFWVEANNAPSAEIRADAEAMSARVTPLGPSALPHSRSPGEILRNALCWFGSLLKFKRCHGR